ncbi:amphi-Trp domain-containing protein [Halomicrobium zhouii]|uniref:Amphi-Trp domain-containing protein n=1 Tax=Halomicrobium zhouii TaxID=767519 RepID=A0A1I6KZL5_9EURY|nr:HVO_2922 family protein [Halomicrobium zhouii]SFR96637.1 amphi-Trp domain-containing protein [Halomicrobium zhouii]
MSQEYEAERAVSREDAATALRQLADGVAAGSVSIVADAGPVAVDIPDDLTFIAELEQFQGTVELEAELEWQTDDGAIREPADEADSAADAAEAASDAAEATADSAASAPDGTEPVESAADLVGPATDSGAPADDPASKATFELFRDAADEWRWRLRHRNGNVIADSGEGYDRKAGAINGLESVKSNAPLAVVEEQSGD